MSSDSQNDHHPSDASSGSPREVSPVSDHHFHTLGVVKEESEYSSWGRQNSDDRSPTTFIMSSNENIDRISGSPSPSPVRKYFVKWRDQPQPLASSNGLRGIKRSFFDGFGDNQSANRESSEFSMCFDVKQTDTPVVQLYTYVGDQWVENARFVKYEECVEGVDTMWSKPHVPFLLFTSVVALRGVLTSDSVYAALDVEGTTFTDVCTSVLTNLQDVSGVREEELNAIAVFLKINRNHAKNNETKWIRKLTGTGKEFTSGIFVRPPPSRAVSADQLDKNNFLSRRRQNFSRDRFDSISHAGDGLSDTHEVDQRKESSETTTVNSHENKPLLEVLKVEEPRNSYHSVYSSNSTLNFVETVKGHECVQILVGSDSSFRSVKCYVIRLKNTITDRNVTKKSVPLKFVVLILGPQYPSLSYVELGRSLAAMFINKLFYASMLRMHDPSEIVTAIDRFMDDLAVIPPTELDSSDVFQAAEYEKVVRRNRGRHLVRPKRSMIFAHDIPHKNGNITAPRVEPKSKFLRGKSFSCIKEDFMKLRARYCSDFVDAFRDKQVVLTSIVTMYLSLLPPTITFGKIMESVTQGEMGVMESFISTFLCNLIWSLFSAQPMIIQSNTGPVTLFEGSFYHLSAFLGLRYSLVRLFAGMTIFALCFLCCARNGTRRMFQYITQFSEEVFTTLIALIYITETTVFLYREYKLNPSLPFVYYKQFTNPCIESVVTSKGTDLDNTALLHCNVPRPSAGLMTAFIVLLGFGIGYVFRFVRYSSLFNCRFRNCISDFAITMSFFTTIGITYIIVPDGILQTIHVPLFTQWANSTRPTVNFLVSDIDTSHFFYHVLLGIAGGTMLFILLFAETSMCFLMLEQEDRKLQKTFGTEWDLMVVATCTMIASACGLPWLCAASIQTSTHAKSLSFTKRAAPGAKLKVTYVVEQRVTNLFVALSFGCTLFFGVWLQHIPLACLFGIFLYSGVTSMIETEFFKGLINVLHFGKHFRHTEADMNVTANRIRFYRGLQLFGLVLIYGVKQIHVIAILFPLVFIIFIVFRQVTLPLIYSSSELNALDPNETGEYEVFVDDPVVIA